MVLPDPTQLLRQLLRAKSVTPDESKCQDILAKQLGAAGFKVEHLDFGGVRNLWASLAGESEEYLVFCGHSDVVPAGDEKMWQHAPFGAEEADGFIYGRGATDMKGSLAAFLTATAGFLSSHRNRKLPNSFGILITGDEEGDAVHGTEAVLKQLKQRGLHISHCLVGEPTSASVFGDRIKNGRRGSLTLRLTLRGKQGHPGYMLSSENVLHLAAALVDKLGFRNTAQDVPGKRTVFHLAATLMDKLGFRNTAQDVPGEGTVFHLTDIRSETIAENVTAPGVSLQGNWRYSSDVRAETLQKEAEQIIKELIKDKCVLDEIRWTVGARPYLRQPGRLADALTQSITEICGTPPQLSVAGGVSDGRFFADYDSKMEIMEFGPRTLKMHEPNERISSDELQKLTTTYGRCLELFFNVPER